MTISSGPWATANGNRNMTISTAGHGPRPMGIGARPARLELICDVELRRSTTFGGLAPFRNEFISFRRSEGGLEGEGQKYDTDEHFPSRCLAQSPRRAIMKSSTDATRKARELWLVWRNARSNSDDIVPLVRKSRNRDSTASLAERRAPLTCQG